MALTREFKESVQARMNQPVDTDPPMLRPARS